MACDPQTLVDNARCLEQNIPSGMNLPVLIWLACQIVAGKACIAPAAPVIQARQFEPGHVQLSWLTYTPNPGFGFVGYWGTTSGGPYPFSQIMPDPSQRQLDIFGLTGGGTTWFFVVTAKNLMDSCESVFSNQRSVIVF